MFGPANPKGGCPHCESSEMEYLGFTFGGLHYYYKCPGCQQYTEYRITSKNYLIMSSIILLMMVLAIVVPLSVFNVNSRMAMLVFAGSVVLFSIIAIRYEWYFYEPIALEDLPTDLWIIRAPRKNIRSIIIAIFVFVLLLYGGILIINLMRQ